MPMALLMGVDWADCRHAGSLLGMKTFLNEFVAYEELAQLMKNRQDCVEPSISVRRVRRFPVFVSFNNLVLF